MHFWYNKTTHIKGKILNTSILKAFVKEQSEKQIQGSVFRESILWV